ncbi:MAG: hypothetical protein HKO76_04610 [Acidimicrobiia bacterium]|nr:hypothetical protein [Acidimicrobiia bacterium]
MGYNLDDWYQEFVSCLVQGMNGTQAVHSADAKTGRKKKRTDSAAGKWACNILNHKTPKSNEVACALKHRKERAALEAGITEAEVHKGMRLLYMVGMGEATVRKTLVMKDKEGNQDAIETEVREPNLAAAGKAVEMMAKSIGLFNEDSDARRGQTHEEALDELE